MTDTTLLAGVVTAMNERGVQLDGSKWYNVSRFAEGVEIPMKGESVLLTLDKAGFIRYIVSDAEPTASRANPSARALASGPDRERLIVRQSSLRAAVDWYGTERTDQLQDLLDAAEIFEAWVCR